MRENALLPPPSRVVSRPNSLSLPLSNACHAGNGGGGLIYFKPIRGGEGELNRDGGVLRGKLIYLAKTMVSVLNKKQECQVRKLKYNG